MTAARSLTSKMATHGQQGNILPHRVQSCTGRDYCQVSPFRQSKISFGRPSSLESM